ncbi:hypothetical protein MNV49_004602 [Pseudohyphozyma bogoriensis]|nr:hypothetical protein MNV49_004602 [Pseudohyphozyma bogoriensis]
MAGPLGSLSASDLAGDSRFSLSDVALSADCHDDLDATFVVLPHPAVRQEKATRIDLRELLAERERLQQLHADADDRERDRALLAIGRRSKSSTDDVSDQELESWRRGASSHSHCNVVEPEMEILEQDPLDQSFELPPRPTTPASARLLDVPAPAKEEDDDDVLHINASPFRLDFELPSTPDSSPPSTVKAFRFPPLPQKSETPPSSSAEESEDEALLSAAAAADRYLSWQDDSRTPTSTSTSRALPLPFSPSSFATRPARLPNPRPTLPIQLSRGPSLRTPNGLGLQPPPRPPPRRVGSSRPAPSTRISAEAWNNVSLSASQRIHNSATVPKRRGSSGARAKPVVSKHEERKAVLGPITPPPSPPPSAQSQSGSTRASSMGTSGSEVQSFVASSEGGVGAEA